MLGDLLGRAKPPNTLVPARALQMGHPKKKAVMKGNRGEHASLLSVKQVMYEKPASLMGNTAMRRHSRDMETV